MSAVIANGNVCVPVDTGKNWTLSVAVLFTLPYNCTELLNCFCWSEVSFKSLGILFILSLSKTTLAVLFNSVAWGNIGGSVTPAVLGYAFKKPGK